MSTNAWPPAFLSRQLELVSAIGGGIVGVAAEHLESGKTVDLHGGELFPMASTFKIAVAGAVLQRVQDGEIALTDMVAVEERHKVISDILASNLIHPGISLSLHNLLEIMIIWSDNTATDVMVEVAGGPAAVTAWLRKIGVKDQRVDRDTAGIIREFYGWPEGNFMEVFQKVMAANPDAEAKGERPNPSFDDDPRDTTTPKAMIGLLTKIHRGKALDAPRKEVLLAIMARCKTGLGRLKGILPANTVVAHKTGTIGGTVNDAGIIHLPDGTHLAVAAYVKKSDKPMADRERAIAELARTLYDAYLFAG